MSRNYKITSKQTNTSTQGKAEGIAGIEVNKSSKCFFSLRWVDKQICIDFNIKSMLHSMVNLANSAQSLKKDIQESIDVSEGLHRTR